MNGPINNEIFAALKKTIKSKGKTYKEIASGLAMSESGFKKLMNTQDCSLKKLVKVCDALSVSLSDLIDLADNMDKQSIRFNKKQEDVLLNEPSVYCYFHELHRFNYNETQLRKIHKLSKEISLKYLRKLDRINLIELDANDSIKPLFNNRTGIKLSAQLGDKVNANLHKAFFYYTQDQFKKNTKKGHLGTAGRFLLKAETLNEMKKAYSDLTDEFSRRSNREKILFDENELKKVNLMIFMAEDFNQSEHLHIKKI